MLALVPVSLKDANAFVAAHHRHHKPVTGHKFSIGCEAEGRLVGVVIAGRPVSRYLDNGRQPPLHHRREERVQYALLCGGAGGKGDGLPEDHHLYPGHGTGDQPAGGGLVMRRSRWRGTVDGPAPPCYRSLPGTEEITV